MKLLKPSDYSRFEINFEEAITTSNGNKIIKIKEEKTPRFIIETPWLFSFGVKRRKGIKPGDTTGFYIPICLWKKGEKPTKEEQDFYDFINLVEDYCFHHLQKVFGLVVASKMNKICYKEKYDPPIMNPKLIYSKREDKIYSLFRTKENANVDPWDFSNKFCTVKMVLEFDCIFVGDNTVSVQMNAREVYVKKEKVVKPLLNVVESEDEE